jgi:hypothetical protein
MISYNSKIPGITFEKRFRKLCNKESCLIPEIKPPRQYFNLKPSGRIIFTVKVRLHGPYTFNSDPPDPEICDERFAKMFSFFNHR